jgi:hypothetical protein
LSANCVRPSKRAEKLCTHAHHSDRSIAVAIFANGTYFVNTSCIKAQIAVGADTSLKPCTHPPTYSLTVLPMKSWPQI